MSIVNIDQIILINEFACALKYNKLFICAMVQMMLEKKQKYAAIKHYPWDSLLWLSIQNIDN